MTATETKKKASDQNKAGDYTGGRLTVFRQRRRYGTLRRRVKYLWREFYYLFLWKTDNAPENHPDRQRELDEMIKHLPANL